MISYKKLNLLDLKKNNKDEIITTDGVLILKTPQLRITIDDEECINIIEDDNDLSYCKLVDITKFIFSNIYHIKDYKNISIKITDKSLFFNKNKVNINSLSILKNKEYNCIMSIYFIKNCIYLEQLMIL